MDDHYSATEPTRRCGEKDPDVEGQCLGTRHNTQGSWCALFHEVQPALWKANCSVGPRALSRAMERNADLMTFRAVLGVRTTDVQMLP